MLRPNGLQGVVLPSFILFAEKLADELLGVFGDTGEGGDPPNRRSPRKEERRRCVKNEEIEDQNQAIIRLLEVKERDLLPTAVDRRGIIGGTFA